MIRSSILLITLLSALSTSCTETLTNQPVNYKQQLSQQLVLGVLWYQRSAEMVASYEQAYNYAKLLIDAKLDTISSKENLAVVLDIDETVLDNSPFEVELINSKDQYNSQNWKAWVDQGRAKALPGALNFINYAISRNVEVFYISNRRVNTLGPTISNLEAYGFPNADSTHVLLREETSDKTARRQVVSEDYNIILFVGDNLTDYSQIYADRGADMGKELVAANRGELLANFVMLPNPMYGEWEAAIYSNDFSISDSLKVEMRRSQMVP